jgi:hypothetical protein
MKRLHLPQFPIQNLMILIGAIACALALLCWLGLLGTIVILVFPVSLLVERLFGATPTVTKAPLPFIGTAENLGVLIVCASVCTVASWYGSSTGVPTILSPLPLLVAVPLFLASALGYTELWWVVGPIPFVTFCMINFYQLRVRSSAPLPTRFSFLLGLSTVCSIFYFVGGWKYGVRYQGGLYALASAAMNLSIRVVLWGWWLADRRRASKARAFGFGTLLHCWLFWFAFPYLGELP